MNSIGQDRPDICYPCLWQFKVIGGERCALAAAIAEVVGGAEHLVSYGQASSGGKYHSFNLEIVVASELHRDELYRALSAAAEVKVVI